MKASKFVYGISIFLRYLPDFWLNAEHDIIYGPSKDDPELDLNDLEIKFLEQDGWFVDTESGCWATFC